MRSPLRLLQLALLGFTLLLVSPLARAQATQDDVSARLIGKPLYLRGFWTDDKLKFDADGQPEQDYKTSSFTVAGFDATGVEVEGDRVRVTGIRMGLNFGDPNRPERIVMKESSKWRAKPEVVTIEARRGPDGGFGRALDAIFANGFAELQPSLPSFWQAYAASHLVPRGTLAAVAPNTLGDRPAPGTTPQTGLANGTPAVSSPGKPASVGGRVKPPRLLQAVDPNFSEIARRQKFSGNVQVYLWVDENGMPSHVRIVRPVGMGLDEKAVEAVSQYRFAPAMRDGTPVKVDLYIEVNFQIF